VRENPILGPIANGGAASGSRDARRPRYPVRVRPPLARRENVSTFSRMEKREYLMGFQAAKPRPV